MGLVGLHAHFINKQRFTKQFRIFTAFVANLSGYTYSCNGVIQPSTNFVFVSYL
jgi:hypothetical protein